jgi:hypothetical protein
MKKYKNLLYKVRKIQFDYFIFLLKNYFILKNFSYLFTSYIELIYNKIKRKT